jgi:Helix-turn-helix domain
MPAMVWCITDRFPGFRMLWSAYLGFLNFNSNRGVRVDGEDPRLLLARRLRMLREEHWPGMKVSQPQLARALGKGKPLSAALISSWESQTNPAIPPLPHLHAYATLFATRRSFGGTGPA